MGVKSSKHFFRRLGRFANGLIAVAVCPVAVSCSVASLFHEELARENAVVVMNDSTRYEGKTLLPDLKGKTLRFVTADGRRLRFVSDSVAVLAFERDSVVAGAFVYAQYKDQGGRKKDAVWMNCLGMGRHLRLAAVGYSWHFNSQGSLVPVSFADGDAYLIGLKEDGVGEYLTTYGRARAGVIRALCKFLADDPVLCDRLASKEIDAYDFAEICRLYSPQGHDDGDGMNVRMAWNAKAAPCAEKGGGV